MSAALRADGRAVVVEGVSIVSPGLRGQVDVLRAGAAGLRGADSARAVLVEALDATGMQEQRTIVIRDHAIDTAALTVGVSRSTRYGEPGLSLTVPGPGTGMGQVLLAADEAAVLSWVLPDDVPAAEAVTRGGDTRTYTIPIAVPETHDDGRRGLLAAVGKKVLKVLAFKLLDKVAGELANRFAAQWEQNAHPHRLRPFGPDEYRNPNAQALAGADLGRYTGKRTLLFVHGEMNLSHSGFGRLPPEVMQRLYDRYEGRVLAFDHPTVSVTPTANAAWLADLVRGAGLTVDIVAHSRGGLVARMLTEWPDAVGLASGSMDVQRLIMAATPNQGTPLADTDRLSQLVDRVTDLLDFVPDNAVTDVLNMVISVVKQVAVGAYNGLDGIMAMKPGSRWLTELNNQRPNTAAYYAVSSSYEPPEGSPLALIVRDRITDLVFRNIGNDLIVPEAGVHSWNGASPFPVANPLILTAMQSVDHSNYWTSSTVHTKLDEWLVR
jgi:hypothetical protein